MSTRKKRSEAGSLAQVITLESLRRIAGVRSFERGEEYYEIGCVGRLAEYQNRVTASVQGTKKYVVKLAAEKDHLSYDCTCPVGQDGRFCKHGVAVGLAWLAQQRETQRSKEEAAVGRPPTLEDARAYLARQSTDVLVELLMEQALEDDRLRDRLLMRVGMNCAKTGKVNVRPFIDAIENAIETHDFVSYREAWDYASAIDKAVDGIDALLSNGHAAEALEVIEHAHGMVNKAIEHVDDSDGNMGGILERLAELHLVACRSAKLDPEDLAERLFDLEMHSEYGDFYGAVARYSRLLRKKGLAKYRAFAEAEWAKVPARGPEKGIGGWGEYYKITVIMETLARMSGDLDEWIAVKSRDLSCAYRYLEIAEGCKKKQQYDQALEWAERGVTAFPERTDSRLREFLADEYHRRKRHDEAMALIWTELEESPSLQTYQLLKSHAQRIHKWPAWRERALRGIEAFIAKEKRQPKPRYGWHRTTDHSVLVEIFLWEKDADAAWKAAQEGGCETTLWLKLAEARAVKHPEDALPIYQKQIEPTLAARNNAAYEEAVKYLSIIRDLMVRLDQKEAFDAYLASIRIAHKPKRNFMKLLEQFKG